MFQSIASGIAEVDSGLLFSEADLVILRQTIEAYEKGNGEVSQSDIENWVDKYVL